MAIVTEEKLRATLSSQDLDSMEVYRVASKTIVTPAARSFLCDHRIRIVFDAPTPSPESTVPSSESTAPSPESAAPSASLESPAPLSTSCSTCYQGIDGSYYDTKPEHMTALHGRVLVTKDHKIIKFRGRIDSFQAKLIMTQHAFEAMGHAAVAKDLQDVMLCAREIMRCEVLNKPMPELALLGMSEDEIHERSHHPKKFYGIGHFLPDYSKGIEVAYLNELRTQVREVELVAYETFKGEDGLPTRGDIIQALNRLSSLCYVMMFRVLAKEYDNGT